MKFFREATPEPKWLVELPRCILGSMAPYYHALTDSVFVCDGLGSSFSSIRLRRLDFATGKEEASARLGNVVRCLTESEEGKLLAALDNRLVEVDPFSLQVLRTWKDRIPRYSDHLIRLGESAVMMNRLGPSLARFDLETSRTTRKSVGSCEGLFLRRGAEVVVCSGKQGHVSIYKPAAESIETLEFAQFMHASYAPGKDLLILGLGNPFESTATRIQVFRKARMLMFYQVEGARAFQIQSPSWFELMQVAPDGLELFLAHDGWVGCYKLGDSGLELFRRTPIPADFEVKSIVREHPSALTVDRLSKGGRRLGCLPLGA